MTKKKITKVIISLLIVMSLTTQISFAHSGRTDSNGGHKDNKNVSGLGSYHYHCGGYPAHLHSNGVCPYSNNPSSSSSNSSALSASDSRIETAKNDAKENGYNAGYQTGTNGDDFKDDNSSSYSSEYKAGYLSGYEKGKSELETKIKDAYDEGYALGSKGENENNSYTVQVIKNSYSEGYKEGLKVYIKENKSKYIELGEEDAVNFEMRNFECSVPSQLKEEYTNAYNNKTSELNKIAYDKGYTQAISNKEVDASSFKNDEEIDSYNKGYNTGKIDLEEEGKIAYEYGYNEKEYFVPEELAIAKDVLLASYSKGTEIVKAEKERRIKVITITVMILLAGVISGIVIKKKKILLKDDMKNVDENNEKKDK